MNFASYNNVRLIIIVRSTDRVDVTTRVGRSSRVL